MVFFIKHKKTMVNWEATERMVPD